MALARLQSIVVILVKVIGLLLIVSGDARWSGGVVVQGQSVDTENEGGADESLETSTPLAIRSVEIYVDERPDFSFLASPELYMFCLPNGTSHTVLSETYIYIYTRACVRTSTLNVVVAGASYALIYDADTHTYVCMCVCVFSMYVYIHSNRRTE